jgi:hypothetical protein
MTETVKNVRAIIAIWLVGLAVKIYPQIVFDIAKAVARVVAERPPAVVQKSPAGKR